MYVSYVSAGICTKWQWRTFGEECNNCGSRHAVEDVEPAIPVVQLCTVVDDGDSQSQDDSTGVLSHEGGGGGHGSFHIS